MKNVFMCTLFFLMTNFIIAQTYDCQSINKEIAARGYKLLYSDEFNKLGKPNSSDWLFRINSKCGGESTPENVIQEKIKSGEGCLLIKFTEDTTSSNSKKYFGGGVISSHNFGYGYYEARVQLYGGSKELSGFHQSFWSMGLTGSEEAEGIGVRDNLVHSGKFPAENRVLEIDGFELDSKNNILGQCYHIYTPKHTYESPLPNGISKDLSKWIVMGYEWLPDRINFYCDGKFISTKMLVGKWKVFAPQNFWLTALPGTVPNWGGVHLPKEDVSMKIDYFRYYAKSLPKTNRIGNADFEYGESGNTYPIAWIVIDTNAYCKEAVRVITDSTQAFSGKRFLLMKNHSKIKQILEYIPNGKYSFSAYIKGLKGQKYSMFIIKSGRKFYKKSVVMENKWTKISIKNILVVNNEAIIEINSPFLEGQKIQIDNVRFEEY